MNLLLKFNIQVYLEKDYCYNLNNDNLIMQNAREEQQLCRKEATIFIRIPQGVENKKKDKERKMK